MIEQPEPSKVICPLVDFAKKHFKHYWAAMSYVFAVPFILDILKILSSLGGNLNSSRCK